ncbi:MAG: hypothetical protein IPK60_13620 [Sandaracinaceae bacterium]|jgi:hypothetical protein|nr:hypothetical protein [Sandaracinaceae bacterium]
MRTKADLEAYLRSSGQHVEDVAENTWLVRDPYDASKSIAVAINDGVVLFRMKVIELAEVKRDRDKLFQRLLELNAAEMLHGAYGVGNDAILITCALRLENLDMSELQATLDDFAVAFTKHYQTIASFRDAGH